MAETTSSPAEPTTCPLVDFAPLDQRGHDGYWKAMARASAAVPSLMAR
jgi:hypothetical protein